jgi:PBP1b-binding outer membrane lipoprotein LpoB
MKTLIAIILCFFILEGCSAQPSEHSPPPTTQTNTAVQQQDEEDDTVLQALMCSVVNNLTPRII